MIYIIYSDANVALHKQIGFNFLRRSFLNSLLTHKQNQGSQTNAWDL